MRVYFGTYTRDRDESIYQFEFDPGSGRLTPAGGSGAVTNPSFLAVHPEGTHLYSVAESNEMDGRPGGGVAAYTIDPDDGSLSLINSRSSGGPGACHVEVDPAGTTAIVSNYGGGSVSSFPIRPDGSLGEAASCYPHEGASVDPDRQNEPHTHSACVAPAGGFAVVADLGIDRLLVYEVNGETGGLTPHEPASAALHPGAGPRHTAFHPAGPWLYCINELDATLTVMDWDGAAGTLTSKQTVSTLPDDWDGRRSTAEVAVHPNGRFLYGSNRGHDSLVIYSIDPQSGELFRIGFCGLPGKEPRHFGLEPGGRWLISCHQNSDHVQVFAVDAQTGLLDAVGDPVSVPMPVCVKFLDAG
jgi:6-phosphogluconolactonase